MTEVPARAAPTRRPGGSSSLLAGDKTSSVVQTNQGERPIRPGPKSVSERTFKRHSKKVANRAIANVEQGFARGSGRAARLTRASGVRESANAQVRKRMRVRPSIKTNK